MRFFILQMATRHLTDRPSLEIYLILWGEMILSSLSTYRKYKKLQKSSIFFFYDKHETCLISAHFQEYI